MIYLRSSVGVEIRQDDLLVSCLQSNFSTGVFTHFKRFANYRQREREEVRRELLQFFKEKKLDKSNVVLGLPRSDIIIRYLDLPIEVADNLKQVVSYQVQSFEPTEDEKFYHDYALVRPKEGAKRLQVLLVMVKKAVLDAHLGILKEFGLVPVSVTSSTVALSNLFLQNQKESSSKTYILAQLTPSGIEIITLRDGTLAYSRGSSTADATNWKDLFLREVEEATGKVRMGPDDTIEKLVIAGDGAENAQQSLSEDVPGCELIGGSIRFEMPPENKPHLQEGAASLGLAYSGMVRRPPMKLNLLPQELRVRQTRWAYIPTIILGLAIIGLLAALGVRQMFQERVLSRQLDQEIQTLQPRVERVRGIRSQADSLEKRVTFLEGLLRKRDMNLEVLQELTTVLPQDSYIQTYTNHDGSITIGGLSPSASDLIPKLEQSPLLKDVTQRGTIFKDAQNGKDHFNFEAKLEKTSP